MLWEVRKREGSDIFGLVDVGTIYEMGRRNKDKEPRIQPGTCGKVRLEMETVKAVNCSVWCRESMEGDG